VNCHEFTAAVIEGSVLAAGLLVLILLHNYLSKKGDR